MVPKAVKRRSVVKNFDEETWIALIDRVREVLVRERLLNLLPQQDRSIIVMGIRRQLLTMKFGEPMRG